MTQVHTDAASRSGQVETGDGEQIRARRCDRASPGSPPHAAGMLWFGGWLFTIGFAKLVWWKAVLALVIWPYFLGVMIR